MMPTDSDLQHIHKKVDEIQVGLLRFQDEEKQVNLHVRAKCKDDNAIDCVMTESNDLVKLLNKKVSLVQKSDKNYLYITGEVSGPVNKNKKSVSIRIVRACWFVLKSKGSVSWLQEKYIYDISPGADLEIAS